MIVCRLIFICLLVVFFVIRGRFATGEPILTNFYVSPPELERLGIDIVLDITLTVDFLGELFCRSIEVKKGSHKCFLEEGFKFGGPAELLHWNFLITVTLPLAFL